MKIVPGRKTDVHRPSGLAEDRRSHRGQLDPGVPKAHLVLPALGL
ncbi:hypothetical protein ACL02T_15460 [Pseudonocardia sp. RS010]